MPDNKPEHPHLVWHRLDIVEPRGEKETKGFTPPTPFRRDQARHGTTIRTQTETAVKEVEEQMKLSGVDPTRLLVLEMDFLETSQKDALEKMGLQILEEEESKQDLNKPYYPIKIQFEAALDLQPFEKKIDRKKLSISEIVGVRGSKGKVSSDKLEIQFQDKAAAETFWKDEKLHKKWKFQTLGKTQPSKKNSISTTRILVQFPSKKELEEFQQLQERYGGGESTTITKRLKLNDSELHALLDSISQVRSLTPEDRKGYRLQNEGIPKKLEFAIDVDLWHPGTNPLAAEMTRKFRDFVKNHGGKVTDGPYSVADSLFLARVKGNEQTLTAILNYPHVAVADLPPLLPSKPLTIFEADTKIPKDLPKAPNNAPIVCVVDSGVVAGHPLLSGWVYDERNFDSGEDTHVDQSGHGTCVAGIAVYGDVFSCIQSSNWNPKVRLISAKVLKNDGTGIAVFPEDNDKRVETQLRNVIDWIVEHYKECRVVNLSIGHFHRTYLEGRQLPWALVLDELALKHDIVFVVAAGNVSNPIVPIANTKTEFQEKVRDQLLSDEHALIDPASSMLSLTVGSIARTDVTRQHFEDGDGRRSPQVGSPTDGPSPFTRTGIVASSGSGVIRTIKPELIAYGGNYFLSSGNQWMSNDYHLGEPSLRHDFQGNRLLKTATGTSVAAPFISHVAARVEHRLREIPGIALPISANLIRALVVHSAEIPEKTEEWITQNDSSAESNQKLLRMVGYGIPNVERALNSTDNRVVLLAQDELKDGYYHIYELKIPKEYNEKRTSKKHKRFIRATLAYDPPVRGTRKEYLMRLLYIRLLCGKTVQSIQEEMKRGKDLAQPKIWPGISLIERSTVQSAFYEQTKTKEYEEGVEPQEELLHIVVRSEGRMTMETDPPQKYALVVSFEHSDATVKLYDKIRRRVEQRVRV